MQKEAAANIELYCNETVIKDLSYNTRKPYTIALMSALCKQNKKSAGTILPVKFYGGANIMKRRFKNILIKKIIEKFSNAYFNGNKKNLKRFLAKSYNQDIDIYTEPGKISDVTLKGLENIGNEKDGKNCTVSLEFKDIKESSDSFLYLIIGLKKQSGKWKINSYGLER